MAVCVDYAYVVILSNPYKPEAMVCLSGPTKQEIRTYGFSLACARGIADGREGTTHLGWDV